MNPVLVPGSGCSARSTSAAKPHMKTSATEESVESAVPSESLRSAHPSPSDTAPMPAPQSAPGAGSASDPNQESATYNLLDLPQELFDLTLGYLDPSDLHDLRDVSAQCAHKTRKIFAAQCGRSCQNFLLCDKESLETAVKIAGDPDFGPAMKEIRLDMAEIRAWKVGPLFEDANPVSNFFAFVKQLWRKRVELTATKGDVHLLTTAFSHLRKHGKLETLHLSAGISGHSTYLISDRTYGRDKYEMLGSFGLFRPELSNGRALSVAFEALSLSGLTPEKVRFPEMNQWPLTVAVFLQNTSLPDLLSQAFHKVEHIDLTFDHLAGQDQRIRPFIRTFFTSQSLKSIQLHVNTDIARKVFNGSTREWMEKQGDMTASALFSELLHGHMPRLERLDLAGYGKVEVAEFRAFIARHSETLRAVEMQTGDIEDDQASIFANSNWSGSMNKTQDMRQALGIPDSIAFNDYSIVDV